MRFLIGHAGEILECLSDLDKERSPPRPFSEASAATSLQWMVTPSAKGIR
jgi:hypothetical protein